MSAFFRTALIFIVMLAGGQAQAQGNYSDVCIEGNPAGYMICRLKPDGFTAWVYGSGYGIAPHDVLGGYSTEAKAVHETMNYLVYSNPNFKSMCAVSHSLAGTTNIYNRDGFILSNESVWQSRTLNITYGWIRAGKCEDISTGGWKSMPSVPSSAIMSGVAVGIGLLICRATCVSARRIKPRRLVKHVPKMPSKATPSLFLPEKRWSQRWTWSMQAPCRWSSGGSIEAIEHGTRIFGSAATSKGRFRAPWGSAGFITTIFTLRLPLRIPVARSTPKAALKPAWMWAQGPWW